MCFIAIPAYISYIYSSLKQYYMKRFFIAALCSVPLLFNGCSKDGTINIFTIEDDKQLGLQVKAEILADPAEFPILDPSTNAAAYNYINAIRNDILNTNTVDYKDEFLWEVYIVKRDDIQNAFCTPGGYIYIYTGLIKYLDSKSALAGVMGHEMAHADKRHSTDQLTKIYGIQTLLDVALGKNQGMVSQIASQLVSLEFSRDNETEADQFSVHYLCPTKYRADGSADFFQKIIDEGTASSPPEFLSTHPNPDNRVQYIRTKAQEKACVSSITQDEEINSYQAFKAAL